jgi:hypothetical protein
MSDCIKLQRFASLAAELSKMSLMSKLLGKRGGPFSPECSLFYNTRSSYIGSEDPKGGDKKIRCISPEKTATSGKICFLEICEPTFFS